MIRTSTNSYAGTEFLTAPISSDDLRGYKYLYVTAPVDLQKIVEKSGGWDELYTALVAIILEDGIYEENVEINEALPVDMTRDDDQVIFYVDMTLLDAPDEPESDDNTFRMDFEEPQLYDWRTKRNQDKAETVKGDTWYPETIYAENLREEEEVNVTEAVDPDDILNGRRYSLNAGNVVLRCIDDFPYYDVEGDMEIVDVTKDCRLIISAGITVPADPDSYNDYTYY